MDDQACDNTRTEEAELEKKECEVNVPAEPVEHHVPERRRGKEEKSRKRDDRRLEKYLKGSSDVHSVEEKLDLMCKKYSEALDENKRLQATMKQYDRKVQALLREKEQFQNEQSKEILVRKRLESLCRELQKQNKAVKKESLLKTKEQEHMRKVLSDQFRSSIAQITGGMNLTIQRNGQLCEEQLELKEMGKALCEQMKQKQQEMMEINQAMKFQVRLANTKVTQAQLNATAEKEEFLKEKQQLLCKMKDYQEQIKELQTIEAGLRSQINIYTDKYDEFQNALSRSDKIYGEFNQEMQKMSKKILSLEKETALWKERWAKSHNALLEMATEKQARDAETAKLNEKFTLLQNLCKVLQRERNNLLALKRESEKKSKSSESEAPSTETAESPKKNETEMNNVLENCLKLKETPDKTEDAESKPEKLENKEDKLEQNSVKDKTVNGIPERKPESKRCDNNDSSTESTETNSTKVEVVTADENALPQGELEQCANNKEDKASSSLEPEVTIADQDALPKQEHKECAENNDNIESKGISVDHEVATTDENISPEEQAKQCDTTGTEENKEINPVEPELIITGQNSLPEEQSKQCNSNDNNENKEISTAEFEITTTGENALAEEQSNQCDSTGNSVDTKEISSAEPQVTTTIEEAVNALQVEQLCDSSENNLENNEVSLIKSEDIEEHSKTCDSTGNVKNAEINSIIPEVTTTTENILPEQSELCDSADSVGDKELNTVELQITSTDGELTGTLAEQPKNDNGSDNSLEKKEINSTETQVTTTEGADHKISEKEKFEQQKESVPEPHHSSEITNSKESSRTDCNIIAAESMNLSNEVETLHSKATNLIKQLYEVMDSAKAPAPVKNVDVDPALGSANHESNIVNDELSETRETLNQTTESLLDSVEAIEKRGETEKVTEKSADTTVEGKDDTKVKVTKESGKQSAKNENAERKSNETAKSGRRKRK